MERKSLRDQAEVLRDELYMRDRISALLKEGPKLISEIADALGYPPAEVTMWVMSMRKEGLVEELPKARADDYFQYGLVEEDETC